MSQPLFIVSSLRRGHANLVCIIPILTYVPKDQPLFRNSQCLNAKPHLCCTLRTISSSDPSCHPPLRISKGYNGFRPSTRWVDCWACWTLPARHKISKDSERNRNYSYVCFTRNNLTSSALMLSK